jgi:hypothetical protein
LDYVALIQRLTPTLDGQPLKSGSVLNAVKKKPDALKRIELNFVCDGF